MDLEIKEKKKELRKVLRARRDDAARREPMASMDLCDVFFENVKVPENTCFAAYMAMGSEMNPAPLVEALWNKGHRFCLPVVEKKGIPLAFRAYTPGDALRLGPMDVLEPFTSVPLVQPDVVLVPLVGFNWQGYRLGQGGGFYDITLKALRAQRRITAIGLAYAAQEIDDLYVEDHDTKLDAIVTEIEYFNAP